MNKLNKNHLLCLVTDTQLCGLRSLEDVVELAVRGGVNVVQLREKNATTNEFLQSGKRLKSMLDVYKVPLIINDRIDITLALDAAGLHLGQSDMSYAIARKILGYEKIIGLSVNTLVQAKQTENLDVDYLGVGPVFQTQTKSDAGQPWNINDLKKLREFSKHILIGIGGINAGNADKVLEIGFEGIAVISAICAAADPQKSATQLFNIVKAASVSGGGGGYEC
ncbi:Thiamine-phosphate synthase [Gammaproteobacteria bacterium]